VFLKKGALNRLTKEQRDALKYVAGESKTQSGFINIQFLLTNKSINFLSSILF